MRERTHACGRREFLRAAALLASGAALLPRAAARAAEGYSASAETEAALADAQARYEAAQEQIAYLNDLVFDAQVALDQTTDALNATVAQIAELQASIEQKQAELAAAQDVLAERMSASYQAGTAGMLDILLNAADFEDFVTRLYYANKVSDSDAAAIQDVKDIKASLEADQAALEQQRAAQEQLQAQQAEELSSLNDQVAAAEDYAAGLDGEVQALIAQRDAEIAAAAEAARQAAEAEAARQAAAAEAAGSSSYGWDGGDSYSSGSSGGSSGYQPASVVDAGYSYIGTPYSVLDCSGFTSAAYADCGYYLYHQSGVQYNTVVSKGNLVGADSLVPGNLVFYARGGSIYHVGLYIGGGYVIDSIPNGGVQVRSLYFCDGFCGGGSPL